MKRFFQYIILASTLLVTSFSLSGCKEDGIIDEDTMAQIYAEMLITDQWVNANTRFRTVADTSLVYDPILNKYGHTSDDYRRSVEYYLSDPDEYAEIMQETVNILDKKILTLNDRKAEQERLKALREYVQKVSKNVKFSESWSFIGIFDRDELADSLSFEWDSLEYGFRMTNLRFADKEEKIDTLAVSDTVTFADSLVGVESFQVLDTVPKIDTTVKKILKNNPRPTPFIKKAGLKVTDSLSKINRVWE